LIFGRLEHIADASDRLNESGVAEQSKALFDLAPEPKRISELIGSHSRAIHETTKTYLQTAMDFLEEIFSHE